MNARWRNRACNLVLASMLLFMASTTPAAPKDPENYAPPVFGFTQLQPGAIVEGSTEYGGITRDFLVDWDAPEFQGLREFARTTRLRHLSAPEVAEQLKQFIRNHLLPLRSEDPRYRAVLRVSAPIPLSHFARQAVASCRENAYVMHMAMTEAGVPNRLAYAHINQVVQNSSDHAFVVYYDGPILKVADSTDWEGLHGNSLAHGVSRGPLVSQNAFPRYWNPKSGSGPRPSFEEFTRVVQHVLERVPDLVPIWKAGRQENADLRLGGGALRGVLKWTADMLKHNSPTEVMAMTPPPLDALLLNQNADRDIYTADGRSERLGQVKAFQGWEITEDHGFAFSIEAGGTTLDKIRISPVRVDDPLGGLRSFYDQRLEYVFRPRAELLENFWFKERGNSETAMILRFLRMAQDFPELQIADEVWANFGRAASVERGKLTEPTQRHWVNKGLKKLFEASFGDPFSALVSLRKSGLLSSLAAGGFKIPIHVNIPFQFGDLRSVGFSDAEARAAQSICDLAYNGIAEFAQRLDRTGTLKSAKNLLDRSLQLVRSIDEYIQLFSASAQRTQAAKDARAEGVERSLDFFFELKPTLFDVKRLIATGQFPEATDAVIFGRGVELTTTPQEYIELLTPLPEFASIAAHRTTLATVCLKSLDRFFSLKPSIQDLRTLMTSGGFPDKTGVDGAILRRGGLTAQTPDHFIELFTHFPEWPHEVFRKVRAAALTESIDRFFEFNPSGEQIEKLIAAAMLPNAIDGMILVGARPRIPEAEFDRLRRVFPLADIPNGCLKSALRKTIKALTGMGRMSNP